MKSELLLAVKQIAASKELPEEAVLNAIEAALVSAFKRNYGAGNNVRATLDRMTGEMRIFLDKDVVAEVEDPNNQMSLAEARELNPTVEVGGTVSIDSTPENFGRIAAQTAKQVILQRLREAERDSVYQYFAEREGEIIAGTVQNVDHITGTITVDLQRGEGVLERSEQLPTERYRINSRVSAYLMEVHRGTRGPQVKLSRTHRNLLRRLMEQEVPEIFSGTVEIKSIAREPGARSKVAVAALQPGVDPVGSCVGMRGTRIQNIVNELNGEKIDVVEWNADPALFIANSLSPAKVSHVVLQDNDEGKTAIVIVPDKQLSLAIGKEGQNARLSAKLTGWRIDIKSESESMTEGLDKLVRDSARLATAPGGDLLSKAEAILREKRAATEAQFAAARAAVVGSQPAPLGEFAPEEPTETPVAAEPQAEVTPDIVEAQPVAETTVPEATPEAAEAETVTVTVTPESFDVPVDAEFIVGPQPRRTPLADVPPAGDAPGGEGEDDEGRRTKKKAKKKRQPGDSEPDFAARRKPARGRGWGDEIDEE